MLSPARHPLRLLAIVAILSFAALSGCQRAERAAAEADDLLYVNLLWHQHQPLYYKDPATGIYSRPWVRVHATKDYYDMAATVAKYPGVHVTFNLTPVLLKQLDDLAAGAKDYYQVLAEKPADALSEEEKRFVLERFFDANASHVIARFPRYAELLAKKTAAGSIDTAVSAFSGEDIRDLQIWFNLAWFDPDALAQQPLAALVAKGRGFSEVDKPVIFAESLRIVRQVVQIHKRLQDKRQIEVITTPYAHPILPLLYSTGLAAKGDPSAALPEWYSFANDAIAQLAKSVQIYESSYKRRPAGLWPAEGAVAPEIVKMVSDAGYRWMASGEQVLAKSLGIGDFTRDPADTVNEADALYRPYYVRAQDGAKVAMVFRDLRLSDLVGFEYSGTPGEQAASDLMRRLEAIRLKLKAAEAPGAEAPGAEAPGAEAPGADATGGNTPGASGRGPHLVSIILDGENAWENYDLDGKEFLNALYRQLSQSKTVKTTTVSGFLKRYPRQRELESLWWGAWFSPDYATWIGEPEENTGWDYLARVRKTLADYDVKKTRAADPVSLAKALDFMYLAEGSDWFWWFGSDQDSGNDAYFDQSFRSLLSGVYTSLGLPAPEFLQAPIVPLAPVPAAKPLDTGFTPVIDGVARPGEWDKAARVDERGSVTAGGNDLLRSIYFGIDDASAYIRLEGRDPWSAGAGRAARVYLLWDPKEPASAFTLGGTVLGYGANAYIEATPDGAAGWKLSVYRRGPNDNWTRAGGQARVSVSGRTMEWAVPLSALGDASAVSAIRLRAAISEGSRDISLVPSAGPLEVVLPLVGQATPFLTVKDPQGDDNGPGTYTYPQDVVFKEGVFDLVAFTAAETDQEVIFTFTVRSAIDNPWGSAIRLSVQTFDLYIDTDPGKGTGARMLLEGRGAALAKGNGWEYAIWVEGWNQKLFSLDASGKPSMVTGTPVQVTVDGPRGAVLVRVPKSALPAPTQPTSWGYAAVVLGQDGYPAPGVLRVRDVKKTAEQWRIGGGLDGANATRIIDLAWAGASSQAAILSRFSPLDAAAMPGAPDAYAQIPLVMR